MNQDEQAIRELLQGWHRATADGDVDSVLQLMAEDAVFLLPGKAPMRGRGAFEQGLRSMLAAHRVDSSGDIQELAVAGDMAYCWSWLTVCITPRFGGDASVRSGSVLSVFRKQADGTWLLARDANLLPYAA